MTLKSEQHKESFTAMELLGFLIGLLLTIPTSWTLGWYLDKGWLLGAGLVAAVPLGIFLATRLQKWDEALPPALKPTVLSPGEPVVVTPTPAVKPTAAKLEPRGNLPAGMVEGAILGLLLAWIGSKLLPKGS